MIRNNPLAVALITALLLLGVFACFCVAWWFLGVHELQGLKYQYQAMSRTTSAVQALANDAIEYSRRAPALDPILQQFGMKAGPVPSPPGQTPAVAPSTRPPPRPAP